MATEQERSVIFASDGGLLRAVRSLNGRRALQLGAIGLSVRLVPACFVYGSFDVGAWELVQRYMHSGMNPYLTGKLNWPPLWPVLLLYSQKLQCIYGFPSHFAVKIVPCAADAAIAVVLFFWFVRRNANPAAAYRRALSYAVNPVAIAACSLQGQFESLPSLFTLLAIIAVAKSRADAFPIKTAIWLGLAGLAKTWPLILLPAFIRGARSRSQQIAFSVVAVAPAVLGVGLLYVQDPDTILKYVIHYQGRSGAWGLTAINSWLPERIAIEWSHILLWIMYASVLIVYARMWRRGSVGQVACLGVLTFYVYTPGFGPQYTVWILGMGLAIDWRRTQLFTVIASITLAIMYVYSPFNGEYFNTVLRKPSALFWATNMNAHHRHSLALLFLPLWCYCVWWWWSLQREVLREPSASPSKVDFELK